MAAGALDAFVTPIQMKKNRPGVMVTVLCDEAQIAAMEEILFRETTTLGIRRYPVSRHKLKRQADRGRDPVRPDQGEARLARRPPADVQPRVRRLRPGRRRRRASPLREVYDAAHAAYLARRAAPARRGADLEAASRPTTTAHHAPAEASDLRTPRPGPSSADPRKDPSP